MHTIYFYKTNWECKVLNYMRKQLVAIFKDRIQTQQAQRPYRAALRANETVPLTLSASRDAKCRVEPLGSDYIRGLAGWELCASFCQRD